MVDPEGPQANEYEAKTLLSGVSLPKMTSKIDIGKTLYILVGLAVTAVVVCAVAYVIYFGWK